MRIQKALLWVVVLIQPILIFSQQETSKEMYAIMLENTRTNPQKTIEYSKKLLTFSKENNKLDSVAIAYMYIAKAGRVEGIYEESIRYADLGIEFAEKNELSKAILAELFLTKANNLADLGKPIASAETMFKGVELAKISGDTKAQVTLNHGLGYTYYASGAYKKSKRTLKKNIALIEENKLFDKKSFEVYYKGMAMLSKIYSKSKQKDSAIFYLNKGLQHVLTTSDKFTTMAFYEGLSEIYFEEKNYPKVYENLKRNRAIGNSVGNKFINTLTDYNFAKYYYEIGNYEKSVNELNAIVAYYNLRKDVYKNTNVYKLLAKNYKKLGDFKKANDNYELYVLNFQINLKENKELSNLLQDKELLDLVKQNKQKQTSYFIIGGAVVIALLLLYLVSLSNRKKNDSIKFEKLLNKIASLEQQQKIVDTKDTVLEEKTTTDINKETFDEILIGLQKIEEQHYYLKQECSSYNVAKKIKTNTSYLSKVINAHYKKNFNTYINDLRINYAILKLKEDTQFRAYAIQSISEDIGYKSPDSFTKYFKKRTGLLPSIYIKKLNSIT